ncbi:uncharacterized protein N7515_003572 [Penicillium bovifimosum]|uniref:Uncharacterized protein n=1 Tax=Penicillium bovifimosum TaxID=126998 RepID=A0A9W9H686_9EURO|nr:uncharacterized protein N7515_003572 [Penicillium bovifimosum]KAJ5138724.1 hypothetical protein N7515_003572 [Penicillium bovifimosum]
MSSQSKGHSSASQARLAAQIKSSEETPQELSGDTLWGDKFGPEIQHEKDGNINALQRHRYITFRNYHASSQLRDVSGNLLNTEEELREVVQEEIAIREGDHTSSENSKDRLLSLNAKYWTLSQEWWRWRSGLAHGFQSRGFELWRSHPKWYMHRDLIEECAGRQGCCARACGCCVNRDIDDSRTLGAGHCTLECGCCERARGFKVSNEEKKRLEELYKIDKQAEDKGSDFHSLRISRLSIWGLVGDSRKDPFDMIDAKPSYEEMPKNNKRLDRLLWIL